MKIVLPLPNVLTTLFIVVTEPLTFDIASFVPWRVGRPHRKAAMAALGSPLLTVSHHKTPWKPTDVNLSGEERRRLRRARHHLVVSSTGTPPHLPGNLQVARATARALARTCDGLLIDPLTGSAVPSCERGPGEPGDFRLHDDWLTWDVQVHGDATCPPWDPSDTGACDCLRVTSKGLSRFGLPEITLDGAACAHHLCATNLLRMVAHRLLADHLSFLGTHPSAAARPLDDHLHIETADQALLPGGHSGGHPGPPFTVRLTPCDADLGEPGRAGSIRRLKVSPAPGTGRVTCLKVGPPSGFTGSLNNWLCATQGVSHASLTSIGHHLTDPAAALAA
ncbi:hypothetical protein HII36_08855 [Nonomuraea sp. NN258]|uniref:hypothetical protein n=1 Tax=Nonomuraea antri TaxID=2730852 RepID=UPI001569266D|nr:hypothetical protein [Nonomuraea antri]NRQ31948.1 hypothetical protein [Nonomuraea antri]